MRTGRVFVFLLCGGCGPVGSVLFFLDATDSENAKPEPLVVVQSGPSAITNEADAAFRFSTNRTDLTLEGRLALIGEPPPPFAPIENPLVLEELADGSYEFRVRARAGDKSSEAMHRWTVDTIAPDAPGLPRITTATASST